VIRNAPKSSPARDPDPKCSDRERGRSEKCRNDPKPTSLFAADRAVIEGELGIDFAQTQYALAALRLKMVIETGDARR
jgi:hypothetical protein